MTVLKTRQTEHIREHMNEEWERNKIQLIVINSETQIEEEIINDEGSDDEKYSAKSASCLCWEFHILKVMVGFQWEQARHLRANDDPSSFLWTALSLSLSLIVAEQQEWERRSNCKFSAWECVSWKFHGYCYTWNVAKIFLSTINFHIYYSHQTPLSLSSFGSFLL